MTHESPKIIEPQQSAEPNLPDSSHGQSSCETARPESGRPSRPSQSWIGWGLAVCGFLLLAVGLVFGQTVGFQFVNFDDGAYVYENPLVAKGVTCEGIVRAFTGSRLGNWHPLTWLSHMLDCQLYGLEPTGHHLTSVLLHGAAAVSAFLVLRSLTGRLWPSGFVAAVFAIHPLHVESVAWVSERKDVLSGLLFFLTLAAYASYARHRFSLARYLAVVVLFALGLMAKPMLVTLPFVLLLLDYWPLGRLAAGGSSQEAGDARRDAGGERLGAEINDSPGLQFPATSLSPRAFSPFSRLLLEKLPLFLLAAGCSAATFRNQAAVVNSIDELPGTDRLANAIVSYAAYLGQSFYPVRLAAFYPYRHYDLLSWPVAVALCVLLGITTAAVWWWRKRPFLLVGWLWFLGMLVPVVGLVQVGSQARADRYTYLPQIGICLAIAWTVAELVGASRWRRWVGGAGAAMAIGVLAALAHRQCSTWRDSETLWNHALACTTGNGMAHFNLAALLVQQGKFEEAGRHYLQTTECAPKFASAYNGLGNTLCERGLLDEAVVAYQKALAVDPSYSEFHNNYGFALNRQVRIGEAIEQFRKALELNPQNAAAHENLGLAVGNQGELNEAADHFRKALEIEPQRSVVRLNLGILLFNQGNVAAAVDQWSELLRRQPDVIMALGRLAWVRATCPDASLRNGAEAVELGQRAVQLSGGRQPELLDALAAAYAETGQFSAAIGTARQGLSLAVSQGNHALAAALNQRIAGYRAGVPYREAGNFNSR